MSLFRIGGSGPAAAPKAQEKAAEAAKPVKAPRANPGWAPSAHASRAGLDAARTAVADEAARFIRGNRGGYDSKHGSTVVADGPEITHIAPQWQAAALKELKYLAPKEASVLATMPMAERAQYTSLAATLDAAKNPTAHVALVQLLANDTLHTHDARGGTLLSNLAKVATTPLAAGIDRNRLLGELTLELAQPSNIDQSQKNTCGPTTVGIYLASTRPAEYARLVSGLASPQGTVDIVGGRLSRVMGTAADEKIARSVPQRLLAPALLEYGNGGVLGYSNAEDKSTIGDVPLLPGALPSMVARMIHGVTGRAESGAGGLLTPPTPEARAKLQATLNRDEPVPTMLQYGGRVDLHWVLTTKMDLTSVSFVNPWGREEIMPRQEFDKLLQGVALPD